jgi:glycosyltransferase involved in cell wall biosynthesis
MENISIICTTFNEEMTIEDLLESLASQTFAAKEIIICDGGSLDQTREKIKSFSENHSKYHIKLITKKGNRSVGRNAAITAAATKLIAITDAGCIPDPTWLAELHKQYEITKSPIVAGYYRGLPSTAFEAAVIPYVLVMPDKVDPHNFLPATRSMLLEKKVWISVGGFDEKLSLNEDYPFAKKIKKQGFKISFAPKAVVSWLPRKTLSEFATMISRFAQGDVQAGIVRPKVTFLFARYLLLVMVLGVVLYFSTLKNALSLSLVLFVVYSLWAIQKNGTYAKNGWYWLPVLQYVADFSVMKGSLLGLFSKL